MRIVRRFRPRRVRSAVAILFAATAVTAWFSSAAVLRAGAATEPPGREEAAPARGCADPVHEQLDFWLGSWRVLDRQGREMGVNRIGKDLGGCVIEERWTSAHGGEGRSINYYDPSIRKWRQNWVDARGVLVRYQGEADGGAARFSGQHVAPDGKVILARGALERRPDGSLRHLIEHSADGGATWSVYFDGRYVPLELEARAVPGAPGQAARRPAAEIPPTPEEPAGAAAGRPSSAATDVPQEETPPRAERPAAAPPSAAQRPAPAEAPQRGPVTVLSPEEAGGDAPVQLGSPMTLELALGPLHAIPERYGWTSEQTRRYVAGETWIRRIEAHKRAAGDQVEVEIAVLVGSAKYLQPVDLAIELLSPEGDVLARTEHGDFPVGRALPAQRSREGVEKTLATTIEAQRFSALFEGDRRPRVRLTLTLR